MHPWNQPILDSFEARIAQLPHALLIHGPRGIGKLALAERLGQRLLCEAKDGIKRPCGTCDPCRWIAADNHPDFWRVEPEILWKEPPTDKDKKPSRVIKIEQIRELAEVLHLTKHRGGRLVVLVHPADAMPPATANALLKDLEEPAPNVVFILVSHKPEHLLATIRSRCVAQPVLVPPRDSALSWMAGQGVEGAERWLAYAGGAPLRALQYAAEAETITRLLESPAPVETREKLEQLADALQKTALDKAFTAFGLPPRYQTGGKAGSPQAARAWLAYARQMGRNRLLTEHPLNPKLFSAEMLARRPKT